MLCQFGLPVLSAALCPHCNYLPVLSTTLGCPAGVEDDGYPRGLQPRELEGSLETLRAMAAEVCSAATQLRRMEGALGRVWAVVRVHRLCVDSVAYTDLRIVGKQGLRTGYSSLNLGLGAVLILEIM